MLKIFLLAAVVIIVVFLVVAALQPNDFRVARSTTISAPADVAFAHSKKAWRI